MDILLQILAFSTTVLVLVSVHEAGHFFVARLLGIKVLRFSIGFGKSIWRRTAKNGIEYCVGILPLGGYVKLLDEREVVVPEKEKHLAFNRQSLVTRFLVVLAGPLTNILFAIVAFWIMYAVGYESVRPIIGKVLPETVVATAGVKPNTEIIEVDGQKVKEWQDVILALVKRMGEKGVISLKTLNKSGTLHSYLINIDQWHVDDLNPEPLQNFGIDPYRPHVEPIIDEVEKNSPASRVGLKPGDRILALNDKSLDDFYEFSKFLQKNPKKEVVLNIERNGQQLKLPLKIGTKFVLSGFRTIGYIGIRTKAVDYPEELKRQVHFSVLSAFVPAWNKTWEIFNFNFLVIKKMAKQEISLRSLGGPISIFQTADRALKEGFIVFLSFLGLVSVMLAFVNIVPIPGLDGGHLFFFLLEAIRRKPLSLASEALALRIGMILLLLLMLTVTMNDILRLVV